MSPTKPTPAGRYALWALGFRPFFLAAGAAAVLLLALWALMFHGATTPATYYRSGALWHSHEMLFGYTVAVIAGFLLTAVRNWTGRDTAQGRALAMLVGLWLAGRLVIWLAEWLPDWLVATVDMAFLPVLAWSLATALRAPGQAHNQRLLAILVLLAGANLLVHLQVLGVTAATARPALTGAVLLVVILISVIAGRVLPFFTERALGQAVPRRWAWLDRTAIGLTMALAVLLPWAPMGGWLAGLCLLAAAAHGLRLSGWYHPGIWRRPLLWILHVGYGWVPAGFLLAGLSYWNLGSMSLAMHAFTAGAIGVLTMGMMARVALGHTGRALDAPRVVVVAFGILILAAVSRVLWPLFQPSVYPWAIVSSAFLWALAFALFTASYAPMLLRPRADGQSG